MLDKKNFYYPELFHYLIIVFRSSAWTMKICGNTNSTTLITAVGREFMGHSYVLFSVEPHTNRCAILELSMYLHQQKKKAIYSATTRQMYQF